MRLGRVRKFRLRSVDQISATKCAAWFNASLVTIIGNGAAWMFAIPSHAAIDLTVQLEGEKRS